jgi:hypothetical protein
MRTGLLLPILTMTAARRVTAAGELSAAALLPLLPLLPPPVALADSHAALHADLSTTALNITTGQKVVFMEFPTALSVVSISSRLERPFVQCHGFS